MEYGVLYLENGKPLKSESIIQQTPVKRSYKSLILLCYRSIGRCCVLIPALLGLMAIRHHMVTAETPIGTAVSSWFLLTSQAGRHKWHTT